MKPNTLIDGPLSAVLRMTVLLLLLLVGGGCENTNIPMLIGAGADAINAVTLDDDDVRMLAMRAAAAADQQHQVAPPHSPYSRRLQKLVGGHLHHDGYAFNFRVYLSDKVNAFAMADGTIRVYSGLMDLMNDEELLFVLGHEMGHVVKEHSRRKVVLAYASSALRKGLASQENEIGMIAGSVIGAFAQQLTNAQFSQHEERQADTYGALFMLDQGYTVDPAVSALRKLAALSANHTFLSSHPEPGSRAERLANGDFQEDEGGIFSYVADLVIALKNWIVAVIRFLLNLL